MSPRITLALALAGATALAACAQDSPLDPAATPGEPLLARAAAGPSLDAADAATAEYRITLYNLSPANGGGAAQVLSPPVLAAHRPAVRMYREGRVASDALAAIAEDAVNGPMLDALGASPQVGVVLEGSGVIPPGAMASWELSVAPGFPKLSLATMLVNTNDGFAGVDALQLPSSGSVSVDLHALDAGSEANTELFSDIPGPCCGNPGEGVATAEPVGPHPGILGVGDLDPAQWGWEGAIARLVVERIGG